MDVGVRYPNITMLLSKEHKNLLVGLEIDDQLCERLSDNGETPDDIHIMLQLWRKINANNMLHCLGKRRCEAVKSHFSTNISMPEGLPEFLDRHNAIVYPLRLADMGLLNNIVDDIIIAPLLEDGVKQQVLQRGYVTVSHVWIDGQMDTKGPLCRNVLGDLDAQYIWMDKICINQDDKQEKSLEIPRLKDYYKVAPLCLLAAPGASNKSIIDLDNNITRLWKFHAIIKKQATSTSKLSYSMISSYKEKMDALIGELSKNGVLHHQWFTRIWTLPEMSVTQDLIVSNGDQYAYMTPLIELIREYGRDKSRKMFVDEGIVGCFDTLRMTGGYAKFTLSEAMELSVGRTCSVEEDKIHALVGMVSSIADLSVCYGIGMDETLSASCKLAYENGDISWVLNTSSKGFPTRDARFLCPLDNDRLWLTRDHLKIVDPGITVLGSVHAIECWTHIHEIDTLQHNSNSRLSPDIMLWSNLLAYASNDIRELVKMTGWLGMASSAPFGIILVVVFCMSKPVSGLSVILPSCVKDGITTVLVTRAGEKMHIGRSIIVGRGINRHEEELLVR